jgi:hypothetical protein
MKDVGGRVSEMSPEQIILIARAGSHLYNLAKADSDTDYVVIYVEPLQVTSMTHFSIVMPMNQRYLRSLYLICFAKRNYRLVYFLHNCHSCLIGY